MSLDDKIGYSFDDVLLEPKYSDIESRLDTDVSSKISKNYSVDIPIMATNMSTICGEKMAYTIHQLGGVGALHRFLSIEDQVMIVEHLSDKGVSPLMASIGVGEKEFNRATHLVSAGVDILLIDVAHGHHKSVFEQLHRIKKSYNVDVVVGNVATYKAADHLIRLGADGLRVGVGGGSRCTTRMVTGHGVPNLSALVDVVKARDNFAEKRGEYIPVIIDGGIKNSGDIVKALYFGADIASIGNLLAGTEETPGDVEHTTDGLYKKYYGMSSKDAQDYHLGGMKKGIAPEGFSASVPYKGSAAHVLEELVGGIRSGLSYSGAQNIAQLRTHGDYRLLTPASQSESKLR